MANIDTALSNLLDPDLLGLRAAVQELGDTLTRKQFPGREFGSLPADFNQLKGLNVVTAVRKIDELLYNAVKYEVDFFGVESFNPLYNTNNKFYLSKDHTDFIAGLLQDIVEQDNTGLVSLILRKIGVIDLVMVESEQWDNAVVKFIDIARHTEHRKLLELRGWHKQPVDLRMIEEQPGTVEIEEDDED